MNEQMPRNPWARAQRIVEIIEPWGVIVAVIGLVFGVYQFSEEASEREKERTARNEERLLRSLQIVYDEKISDEIRNKAVEFVIRNQIKTRLERVRGVMVFGNYWDNRDITVLNSSLNFIKGRIFGGYFSLEQEGVLNFLESDIRYADIDVEHVVQPGDLSSIIVLAVSDSNVTGTVFDFRNVQPGATADIVVRLDHLFFFADQPPRIRLRSDQALPNYLENSWIVAFDRDQARDLFDFCEEVKPMARGCHDSDVTRELLRTSVDSAAFGARRVPVSELVERDPAVAIEDEPIVGGAPAIFDPEAGGTGFVTDHEGMTTSPSITDDKPVIVDTEPTIPD